MIDMDELEKRFSYHPPSTPEVGGRHAGIRSACLLLAAVVIDNTPTSREQSLAITALEECMMWANAAIARNQ